MNGDGNRLSDYIKGIVFIILIILLSLYLGLQMGFHYEMEKRENNSENVIYRNDSSEDVTIRYKYELGYESLDDFSKHKDAIYTLYIDDEVAAEAFTNENLSVVSESEKLNKRSLSEKMFEVVLGEKVNKKNIRIEVKIIVEELKGGKWTPVYQAIFMERGPYWSLDKGPIETIRE